MKSAPIYFIHPSNLLTYLSLSTGIGAIWCSLFLHSWHLAGICIGVSVVADVLDGKFARLFNRSAEMTKFGAQIDSLCDAIAFGLAPAICIVVLNNSSDILLFAVSFFYCLCALTRLGFYNIVSIDTSYYTGITTTIAGVFWVCVFLFQPTQIISEALLIILGLSMVVPIKINRPSIRMLFIFIALTLALILMHCYEFSSGN